MLRSFVGPFAISFSVIQFLQMLLILGQQKDNIFGKGFGVEVILELLGYLSVWPTLESLALATLMGSLVAVGTLGERYELAAMKSAGISLFRLLIPLVTICGVIAVGAFAFAFFAKAEVNIRFYTLLTDVKQSQPAFSLKPGLFASIADGYTMRVNERRPDGLLRQVLIYDHTEDRGNVNVTLADSGRMWNDERTLLLKLQLYRGVRYEEPVPDAESPYGQPLNQIYFDTLNTQLDLSGLQLKSSDQKLYSTHQYMLQIHQLYAMLDSLRGRPAQHQRELAANLEPYLQMRLRTEALRSLDSLLAADSLARRILTPLTQQPTHLADSLRALGMSDRSNVFGSAINLARAGQGLASYSNVLMSDAYNDLWAYDYERHIRFTLPFASLLFLFVGAPLGAIIRKGGLGWPTLAGIGVFVMFYLLQTLGKKFAQEGVWAAWLGAWMPIGVLVTMAVFLSYQSATDSVLFDLTAWRQLLGRIWASITRSRTGAEKVVLNS